MILGAFRATRIQSLETLAYVPPIELYLSARLASYRARAAATGIDRLIERHCQRIVDSVGRVARTDIAFVGFNRPAPLTWVREWVARHR